MPRRQRRSLHPLAPKHPTVLPEAFDDAQHANHERDEPGDQRHKQHAREALLRRAYPRRVWAVLEAVARVVARPSRIVEGIEGEGEVRGVQDDEVEVDEQEGDFGRRASKTQPRQCQLEPFHVQHGDDTHGLLRYSSQVM